MDLIVPHIRTDFDAFASMLCAGKLYPEAVPVLPSMLVFKLRELVSLYRDVVDYREVRFLKKMRSLDLGLVVVVDTRKRGQLSEFHSYLDQTQNIVIYDHHPPTSDDLLKGEINHFPYGANCTGLFLKLQEAGIGLSPLEATIVLLGIYADTGNLTYPGTRAEDALAVSELLKMNGDLSVVNHYLRPHLDPAQRSLFREILKKSREIELEGYKVVLVKQKLEKPLPGTSVLLAQASDMLGADAILGVFAANNKPGVQIIVQSHVPEINAGEIMSHFDGGGHPGAAAAFLPRADLDGVAETLLTLMTEVPLPTMKVKDLMTRNVITVPLGMPLKETANYLESRKIRGAPVTNEAGVIVGIISVRDIEKARINGLLESVPTSGFMSENVASVSPDTPLVKALKLITSRNVGHLPVMADDNLVGILSRTDALQVLTGQAGMGRILEPSPADIKVAGRLH